MIRGLKQLLECFKNGEETLRDDEYLGDDGLPRCKRCNGVRIYVSDDGEFTARCACKCQSEERERQERLARFQERQRGANLDVRYRELTFKDAVITEHNGAAYEKCRSYVAHAQEMLENNIGLYIYGENSTGKTFLAACLCNELMWAGYTCLYTSLNGILNEIQGSYDKQGDSEGKLLSGLQARDFVFIDDLGKEFIGREYDARSAKWAEKKLYNVINARYVARRPTVFTSNYSIAELESVLSLDRAITERIDEMATRSIRLKGDDFRETERKAKSELAKKLGI